MVRIITLVLSVTFLLSCEADPGLKKIPKGDPRLVSKGVAIDFFPEVDVLFVVDDSGSMDVFQQDLSSNIDQFVNTIFSSAFIDFHIGVTTSNDSEGWSVTANGKLISTLGPNYVTKNTPDARLILREYLKPGVSGNGFEKFFSMVRDALTEPLLSNENQGFYRDDAHLLVFFLTDAEDQSLNYTPNQFYQFLLDLKNGDTDKLHFAAAIPPVGGPCFTWEEPAVKIEQFTQLINGVNFNICEADYGLELVDVAHRIIDRVSTIYLDEVPIIATIQLEYGSQIIPQASKIGWTYDPQRNVIYLGRELVLLPEPEGTELSIKYEAVYK